ncbi:helix-turn-helix transcriptional regulator [Archangium sp.]|uniref:helix-turn-helix transcriptional regulator n=1 Tax=Archangium sp. TaxID=1872627 RepID=UPI00286D239F|nr:helix-turn-helix transcriptional regulator [Archangium sp.]
MNLDSREWALASELMEAFTSSLELAKLLSRTEGRLCQLLPADSVALCVSKPGRSPDYDWMVTEMLAGLFADYPELAADDFVRGAVVRHPNVVLRDTEMLPRKMLERSQLYRHCRELGMPLEHVMSVLLDMNHGWHGGLTLYRERPRPFSERDRALCQWLTPFLARTVRNCRMFGHVEARGDLLKALSKQQGLECLVVAPPSTEVMRTSRATELLEKWFTPSERSPSGLPQELAEHLAWLVRETGELGLGADTWERTRKNLRLRVTFVQLPEQDGQRLWALVLQEVWHAIPLPAQWRLLLTERQADTVECLLRNWDNALIAEHLGLTEGTVKVHLREVFRKLGVESRLDLIFQAAMGLKPL